MQFSVSAAGRTHIGLVRRRNQDAWYAGRQLFAVADGLGGYVTSDIASKTVIDVLQRCDYPRDGAEQAHLAHDLAQAIHTANIELSRKIALYPNLSGMATTLVAMLISRSVAAVANIGDSRAYLMRDSKILQITEDHNYEHLVADACSLPGVPRSLCRYLDGRSDGRSPGLTFWSLRSGDRFLLCSDGVSSCVPDSQVQNTLSSCGTPADAVDQLIALGLTYGGRDNITAVIVDVQP